MYALSAAGGCGPRPPLWRSAAEKVVDMRGGSVELTQTYFYSLVR